MWSHFSFSKNTRFDTKKEINFKPARLNRMGPTYINTHYYYYYFKVKPITHPFEHEEKQFVFIILFQNICELYDCKNQCLLNCKSSASRYSIIWYICIYPVLCIVHSSFCIFFCSCKQFKSEKKSFYDLK